MSEYSVRICRVQNGFEVSLSDPEIVKANQKRDSAKGPVEPWRDSQKTYVFKDMKAALSFVEKTAEKALPKEEVDSFDTAYDKAAKEAMSEGTKEETKEKTK